MTSIRISLQGEPEFVARLEGVINEFRGRFTTEVDTLTNQLLNEVEQREPYRTGRLMSQTRATEQVTDTKVEGAVWAALDPPDAIKAAALEYGAHGTAAVHAYERAHGAMVSAYDRRVNIQALSFLRDPFEAQRAHIEQEIQALMDQMVEETGG